jgi:UDP-N-acetylglucosamine:LPS N-acetylglucosamine transferase
VTLEERELNGPALSEAIRRLLSDRRQLAEMGRNARALAMPDAAARLADLLFEAEDGARRAAA